MKKLCVLGIVILLPVVTWAKIHIHGKVIGADGKAPILAHVHLTNFQESYRHPLQTETVKDGRFTLDVKKPGIYRLVITAVDHNHPIIPLILSTETPEVELEIQPSPLDYKEQFERVEIIGDWNGFDFNSADTMRKQPDGTFSYEREVQADTVGYQLVGITKGPGMRSVNGTQADYYRYDGGGDYISVLKVKPGKVKILFDPQKLLRTPVKDLPRVVFGKQTPQLQKIWDIDRAVRKQQDAYYAAVTAYRETHKDMEGFQFDWSELMSMLKERMQKESDRVVRQFAAIQLGQIIPPTPKTDSATVAEILQLLPPSSPMWIIAPWLPGRLAYQMDKEKQKQLLKAFANKNPNREVQVEALGQLGMIAAGERNQEAVRRYYERLKNEYSDVRAADFYVKTLNPNKRIAAGKPVPDFEVHLLGSEKRVSNKSLLGKFYLLDFWATWCGPCVAEMKYLHAAYEKFKNKNLTFLSLSFDRKPGDVERFRQRKWKMPWLHTFVKGGFTSELAKTFEVWGIPKPILVGPDGTILEVGGALRGENLEKTLAKHLR